MASASLISFEGGLHASRSLRSFEGGQLLEVGTHGTRNLLTKRRVSQPPRRGIGCAATSRLRFRYTLTRLSRVILFLYRNEVYMFVLFRKERVSLLLTSTYLYFFWTTRCWMYNCPRGSRRLRVTGQGQLVRGRGSRRLARLFQSGEGPDPDPHSHLIHTFAPSLRRVRCR